MVDHRVDEAEVQEGDDQEPLSTLPTFPLSHGAGLHELASGVVDVPSSHKSLLVVVGAIDEAQT